MPARKKLKVFRTPIGFHDAYVAAPSQKAALEAWGADANLFARGSAEEVTDPKLMQEPLSAPGTVFKRLRGSEEEQIAALGEQSARRLRTKGNKTRASKDSAAKPNRKPRPPKPSAAELSDLEEALEDLRKTHRDEERALLVREQELARERQALESRHAREQSKHEQKLDRARQSYDEAMAAWENWEG